jgi:hypothetical protein
MKNGSGAGEWHGKTLPLLSGSKTPILRAWTMADDDNKQEVRKMSYGERLANYEREKSRLPRMARDQKTYEAMLKALAKKWRV